MGDLQAIWEISPLFFGRLCHENVGERVSHVQPMAATTASNCSRKTPKTAKNALEAFGIGNPSPGVINILPPHTKRRRRHTWTEIGMWIC